MIKLIDPKRQAELEDIIVQLGATVGSLTENVEYLRDNNRQLVNEIRGAQQTCRRLEGRVQELERLGRKMDISDTRVGASDSPWDNALFTRTPLDRIKYDLYDSPSMHRTSIPAPGELTGVNMVVTPAYSGSTFEEYVGIDGTVNRVAPRRHSRGIPVSSIRDHEASTVVVDDEF